MHSLFHTHTHTHTLTLSLKHIIFLTQALSLSNTHSHTHIHIERDAIGRTLLINAKTLDVNVLWRLVLLPRIAFVAKGKQHVLSLLSLSLSLSLTHTHTHTQTNIYTVFHIL